MVRHRSLPWILSLSLVLAVASVGLGDPPRELPAGATEEWWSEVHSELAQAALSGAPQWQAEGDLAGAWFGHSVATAGDVNGDGYSDVIVGASYYDAGQTDEGRVFVYHGSADGLSTTAAWTAESDQAGALLGHSVGTAGDVNGDGYSDVIVGADYYDEDFTDEGAVFIWHGGPTGLGADGVPGNADWFGTGGESNAFLGYVVGTAGDVDGDGHSDVLMGAYGYDGGGPADRGIVYVCFGSPSGLEGLCWAAVGDQAGMNVGIAAATAGDVDADGFSDVVVGAYAWDNGMTTNAGAAYLWLGSSTGLGPNGTPGNADWVVQGTQANALLGHAVSTAGDVDGDGYSDVIVGAANHDGAHVDGGRVLLYRGSASGLNTGPSWTLNGDQAGARLGRMVAPAGDVNGDGYADLLLGAPSYDSGETDEGRAYVYLGNATATSLDLAWQEEPDHAGASLGLSGGTAGDVDGDGYSDVIVGAFGDDDGVQIDEGRAFVYRGEAGGPAPTAGWTKEGDISDAAFGCSVASAGDVNGDGYSDIIVGAHLYNAGQSNEGRVFLYYGSATGPALTPGWAAESDQADAAFGLSVASAGDVNGDGYSDVIVGAPYYDDPEALEGRAYLYLGAAGGLSLSAAWTAQSNEVGSMLGYSVGTAGDVNGDGYSDVIVGTGGQFSAGGAFVWHGGPGDLGANGTPANADWTVLGDQVGSRFGSAVGTAGDVNGDGYSDVVVGAPTYVMTQVDGGKAFVYHGSADGLGTDAAWEAALDQLITYFGWGVATAGDVNGDGFSDVIIGASGYANGQTQEGGAFVYHGSGAGLESDPAWTVESNQGNAYLGISVNTAGDVNGDGFSDVIVGARGYDNGQVDEGRAQVYLGSVAGLAAGSGWGAEGDQASAEFGGSVASAGDTNGDGFADVIVGAALFDDSEFTDDHGRARVYFGNAGGGRPTLPRQEQPDGSSPICLSGRSDSETEFRIRALLLSTYGRTRLRLEHEVKPFGALLDGTGTFVESPVDIGIDGEEEVGLLVNGLTPGTAYHWRVRSRYDLARTPFQTHGPWVHIPVNGWNEADLWTAAPPVTAVAAGAGASPTRFELSAAGPSPARGGCRLLLTLGDRSRVHASVLDVQGRTIAVLVEDTMVDAGSHVLSWDGRDGSGATAAAGVYFVQVRSDGETRVRKAVLIR